MTLPEKFNSLIITLSDRAFRGEYEDLSGPRVRVMLEEYFRSVNWELEAGVEIIPDDATKLREVIDKARDEYNIIITTGGTGLGPRDITVDVVSEMLDIEIPGIMELIRVKYGMDKPNALLSRGVAGITGRSLIYTLPGSVKAVNEYMTEILKTLQHAIYMQYGVDVHRKH